MTLTDFKTGEPTVTGNSYVARYESFSVGSEDENYKLSIGQYDATTSTLADALSSGGHNGASFSTKDRDNDGDSTRNCANVFFSGITKYMAQNWQQNLYYGNKYYSSYII